MAKRFERAFWIYPDPLIVATIGGLIAVPSRRTRAWPPADRLAAMSPDPRPSALKFGEHVDGVPWFEAPAPPPLHPCRMQTVFGSQSGLIVERCACGASRLNGRGEWTERNQRVAPSAWSRFWGGVRHVVPRHTP